MVEKVVACLASWVVATGLGGAPRSLAQVVEKAQVQMTE